MRSLANKFQLELKILLVSIVVVFIRIFNNTFGGSIVEGPASTTIILNDSQNSTFEVSFLSKVGNT